MNIYGCHFTYANVDSNTYSLMIANVDTERDERSAGDVTGEYIYRKSDKTFRLLGDSHRESQMVFDVDIVTDDGHIMPQTERRAVEKWLFNKQTFRKFYIDEADDCLGESYEMINGEKKKFYLACRFINPVKIETGDGLIGYRATIECDSGFMWQDEITYTFTAGSSASRGTFTVTIDTDINDYTYPEVLIVTRSGCETFTIRNTTDDADRATTFSNLSGANSITTNGSIAYVGTNYYDKFEGFNFIRLLDGTNTFTYTGEISSIRFRWSNRRFY